MFKKIVGLGFSIKGKNALDAKKYINDLISGGANEFFTGYTPSYWSEKFGFEVSPNGRFSEHEQITDFETLKIICEEIHKNNLELFINLNARYYTKETFSYIKTMIDEFQSIGIDGIICGNISVLEYLKSINYKGKINISTIFALYNKESIRFFLENYKINKIILSREITLREIEDIVNSFSNTKFEVFGEGDFCRYNNGLCYAEHKYGARDICTIVVNDLLYKKKFRADFKKLILDKSIPDLEKIGYFLDKFSDIFERISEILTTLEYDENENLKNELLNIYKLSKNRIDLFFDAISGPNSEKNKKILSYFKGLKYIVNNGNFLNNLDLKNELIELKIELEKSIKTGLEEFFSKIKIIGGEPKLKALEKNLFYSKSDNLNLYSYLFFKKLKNIETVKFPTRGRGYNKKLKIIEKCVKENKIEKDLIDRTSSIERCHYDLTYIFGEKLWFRKLINK